MDGPGAESGGNAEPLSWPELYGLIITATGLPPREVDVMDNDDLADLTASWRKSPPAHVALDRVRQVLMVGLGVKEKAPEEDTDTAQLPPDELKAMLEMLNLRARGGQVGGGASWPP